MGKCSPLWYASAVVYPEGDHYPRAGPVAVAGVSLGYKLLLGLGALGLLWVATSLVTTWIAPASAWGDAAQALLPPTVALVAAGVWVRRVRQRFALVFAAADRLASGAWDEPLAPEVTTRLSDEIDLLLAHLERIRRHTADLLKRVDETGTRVHATSVGLTTTAESFYQDIGSFSATLAGLSRAAQEQSVMAENLQAGMDTIANEAQINRELAETAAADSDRLRETVMGDIRTIESTLAAWEATLDELRRAGEGISAFERTASEISSAVGTIAEIAKRSHVLGLNASLEAARAGDQGEGFAVLAVEIRTLAEDTERRADSIDRILQGFVDQQRSLLRQISDGILRLDEGRQTVGSVRGRMAEFAHTIDAVAMRISRMALAFGTLAERTEHMRQQTAAIHEISQRHAQTTTETVTQTRNEMLVGADQLLHEARNLDRISRDLATWVRRLRVGADVESPA